MHVHFNGETPENHFLLCFNYKSSTKNIINQAINQNLLQNINYPMLLGTHQHLRQRNEQSKVNERASVTFLQAFLYAWYRQACIANTYKYIAYLCKNACALDFDFGPRLSDDFIIHVHNNIFMCKTIKYLHSSIPSFCAL